MTISEEGLRIGSCGKGTAEPEAGGRRQEARGQRFGRGKPRKEESEGRRKSRHRAGQGRAGQQWMGMGTSASEAKRWRFFTGLALGEKVTSY